MSELYISKLKFRGANLEFIKDKSHELVLCSPADTGKTMASCYKTIVICTQVPGMHVAMVRKTFASIGDSVSKTFERVAKGLAIRKIGGTRAERYVFKNGSEIVLIGLDRAEKLLSSEWSLIQVCQAEELTESEWEIAASRVTGRGTEYAHPQIFADCNPSNSKHWLRTRKSIKLITGSHKDNPELYDDSGELTKEGARRMKMADEMYTGVRRQRLLYGIWATAEGAVYDLFQPDVHVHVRPMSDFKQFFLAIDEGYTNPAVILCVGEDSDGRLHIFREFYKTKQLQSIVVEQALSWARELGNPLITCDEAGAGLIADLRAQGLNVVGAKGRTPESTGKHIIMDGVKAVQDRLKVQGDGKPRLTVDPACTNTINEFESYAFKKGTSGQLDKDEPEKMFDHAMDALRYLVAQRMTQTGFASAAGFVESSGGVFGETWEVDLLSPESFS